MWFVNGRLLLSRWDPPCTLSQPWDYLVNLLNDPSLRPVITAFEHQTACVLCWRCADRENFGPPPCRSSAVLMSKDLQSMTEHYWHSPTCPTRFQTNSTTCINKGHYYALCSAGGAEIAGVDNSTRCNPLRHWPTPVISSVIVRSCKVHPCNILRFCPLLRCPSPFFILRQCQLLQFQLTRSALCRCCGYITIENPSTFRISKS